MCLHVGRALATTAIDRRRAIRANRYVRLWVKFNLIHVSVVAFSFRARMLLCASKA